MRHSFLLPVASLLSVLFFTFHLAGDILRGIERGGVNNLPAIPIFVVWLYGALVLAGRRSGYVIVLLGSLLGLAVPVLHMMGRGLGVGGSVPKSNGAFFFVWTIIALGVTSLFSVILSVGGLWGAWKAGSASGALRSPGKPGGMPYSASLPYK